MNIKHKVKNFLKYSLRGECNLAKLKKMGLSVGEDFTMQEGCIIDYSHCWLITIGNHVTFAPRVHILAHDASTKMFLDYTKIGLVTIGDYVFIGANTTVLPNCSIGDRVIVGANSTVTKSLKSNGVYAGSPATYICSLDEYLSRQKEAMTKDNTFDEEWTLRNHITDERKAKMKEALVQGMGYVE